ncbi:MAG: hypothetical protein ACFFAE_17780 [Candidatus Hodarchaeota archaeon]
MTDKIGVKARIKEYKSEEYEKSYYFLEITHTSSLRRMIDYINRADHRQLEIFKNYYGWKLSPIRKKDFLKSLSWERQRKLYLIHAY